MSLAHGGGGASLFDTATIVSPPIDLSNMYDDAELTFWMHARGSSMGSLDVGLANTPNGPFNIVYSQYGEVQTTLMIRGHKLELMWQTTLGKHFM